MPRAPKRCGRTDCTELVVGATYCPTHTAEAKRRPSRHQRGYGTDHEKRVATLRRTATAASLPCWLCGVAINYDLRTPHPMSLAAHHLTRDRSGPLVPTHKTCNELAGQPEPQGMKQ